MIKRFWIFTFLAILLQSCGSLAPVPPPVVAPVILTATLIPSSTPAPQQPTETPLPTLTPIPRPTAQRVLIVSFDGLRPDAIVEANMLNVM